jgi:predicted ester cyclase
MFTQTFRAFPDCRMKPEWSMAEGEHVAVRVTMRATLEGKFEERTPSGRKLVLPQMWMFCLVDGRISGIQVFFDSRMLSDMVGIPLPRMEER